MFSSGIRDNCRVGTRRQRKSRPSFWPTLEPLEQRIALHGSPVRAAVPIERAATDPNAATNQVLSIIGSTVGQFGTLQVTLGALATKMQHQSHAGRQADANHAQSLVQKFVKQENKRFKQVLALAPTVSGSQVFSDVVQLDQEIHQDVLTIKSQMVHTFRQLVTATVTTVPTASSSSRVNPPETAISNRAARSRESSEGLPADAPALNEADAVLVALGTILVDMSGPLQNLPTGPIPDACGGLVTALSLLKYSQMLDTILALGQDLGVFATAQGEGIFLFAYNNAVTEFNAALQRTRQLNAANHVETH